MKNENFKYYIILALCAVVIALSIFSFFKGSKQPTGKQGVQQRPEPIDPELYYNKEMPHLELDVSETKIRFPTNKNLLILGVNRDVDKTVEEYDELFEALELSAYDVEIIILTREKEHNNSRFIKTYLYDNSEFDRYFKIGRGSDFVLLVNKENRIKHFLNRRTALHNIRLLIQRFNSKVNNESE